MPTRFPLVHKLIMENIIWKYFQTMKTDSFVTRRVTRKQHRNKHKLYEEPEKNISSATQLSKKLEKYRPEDKNRPTNRSTTALV